MNTNAINFGNILWALGAIALALLTCLVAAPVSPAVRLAMSLMTLHAMLLTVALALRGRGPIFFRRVIVGRRLGRRCICWRGLLATTVVLVTIAVLVNSVAAAIVGFEPAGLAVLIGAILGIFIAACGLVISLLTPLDRLTPLE